MCFSFFPFSDTQLSANSTTVLYKARLKAVTVARVFLKSHCVWRSWLFEIVRNKRDELEDVRRMWRGQRGRRSLLSSFLHRTVRWRNRLRWICWPPLPRIPPCCLSRSRALSRCCSAMCGYLSQAALDPHWNIQQKSINTKKGILYSSTTWSLSTIWLSNWPNNKINWQK